MKKLLLVALLLLVPFIIFGICQEKPTCEEGYIWEGEWVEEQVVDVEGHWTCSHLRGGSWNLVGDKCKKGQGQGQVADASWEESTYKTIGKWVGECVLIEEEKLTPKPKPEVSSSTGGHRVLSVWENPLYRDEVNEVKAEFLRVRIKLLQTMLAVMRGASL